jgi:Cysteine rich repeat
MSFKHCLVVATVVFSPVLALAEPGPLHGACASDIKALCGSIQPGGGRIRDCMKEHRAQLSNTCKLAIADRMLERRAASPQPPRSQ